MFRKSWRQSLDMQKWTKFKTCSKWIPSMLSLLMKKKRAEIEILWGPRPGGRVQWLHLGDSNKRFFYASIHARRAQNTIRCLRDGGYHTSHFWYKEHKREILLSGDWPWDQFLLRAPFSSRKYWLPRLALGSLERSLFRRWRALWKKLSPRN